MPKNHAIYIGGLGVAVFGGVIIGVALANFTLGVGIAVLGMGLAMMLKS